LTVSSSRRAAVIKLLVELQGQSQDATQQADLAALLSLGEPLPSERSFAARWRKDRGEVLHLLEELSGVVVLLRLEGDGLLAVLVGEVDRA